MVQVDSTYGARSENLSARARETVRPGEPRAHRIEINLALGIEGESNFYAGFTENMSECGVFLATHAPLRIGSIVDLNISLPHQEPIRTRGTVRWQRLHSESNETAPGMGIRFDHISAKDMVRIRAFAEARAPLFFDDEMVDPTRTATLRP